MKVSLPVNESGLLLYGSAATLTATEARGAAFLCDPRGFPPTHALLEQGLGSGRDVKRWLGNRAFDWRALHG